MPTNCPSRDCRSRKWNTIEAGERVVGGSGSSSSGVLAVRDADLPELGKRGSAGSRADRVPDQLASGDHSDRKSDAGRVQKVVPKLLKPSEAMRQWREK